MKDSSRARNVPPAETAGRSWLTWLLVIGCGAVILLALRPRNPSTPSSEPGPSDAVAGGGGSGGGGVVGAARERSIGGLRRSRASQDGGQPPAAVVANRLSAFSQARREIAHELARRGGFEVPADAEHFFDAVQAGNWAEIKGLFNTLSALRNSPDTAKVYGPIWPAIVDAYGAATVATTWPPAELLAYGESVLGSLTPRTIYLSGTEAGRSIPSLLSDGGAAAPMVVTPDVFADPAQLEYLALLHPERLGQLNREDIDRILRRSEAPADSGSVAGVDPKSVRGEILKALIERNPGTTFAVDGSFDLGGLAGDVVPVGPVLEVRPGAGGGGGALPPQRAADTAEYWKATAQRLQGEAALENDAFTRREYAQMAIIQGNVLAGQNLAAEAEQTYRAALTIAPAEYEPLERLSLYLVGQGRQAEASKLIDEFLQTNQGYANLVKDLKRRIETPEPKR